MIIFKQIIAILFTAAHIFLVPYLIWVSKFKSRADLKKYTFNIAEKWGKRLFWWFKIDVELIGAENIPDLPVVVVSNHQAGMDIPLLLGFLPNNVSFIAKKELKKMPVVSIWMRYLNCFFIDRSSARLALASFQECSLLIKEGQSVVIFPEGTRSKELMPFKKGSFKLAVMAGVPILPVTIVGTEKSFLPGRKTVKMIIDKPVPTATVTKDKQEDLVTQVHQTICDNFGKYSQ